MRQFHKPADALPAKEVAAGNVTQLIARPSRPGLVTLANGQSDLGSCIHCPDIPCVYFSDDQISSPVLKDFPFNRSRDVCPFDALSVDVGNAIPVIDDTLCTGCGLCIARCPANAMYTRPDGIAALNNDPNSIFTNVGGRPNADYEKTVARLRAGTWSGSIVRIDEASFDRVLNAVKAAGMSNTKQKLLIRNLLLCLGAEAAISTVGDTNVRIDMWWKAQNILWVTEVDFNEMSLLDSPRALLDDIAVCVSRHAVARDKIGAAIVCMEFPNKRSDYYELISDIEKMASVGVRSVPLAGLLLLLWTHGEMSDIDINQCNAAHKKETVAKAFASLVEAGQKGLLYTRYFGATK